MTALAQRICRTFSTLPSVPARISIEDGDELALRGCSIDFVELVP